MERSPAQVDLVALLADFSQVSSDGKLTVVGAAWNQQFAASPFAICGQLIIPWGAHETDHAVRIELLDMDGEPVTARGNPHPFDITITVHFDPPEELENQSVPFLAPFALNFGPLFIPEGTYVFRFSINGEHHDPWRLPFQRRGRNG